MVQFAAVKNAISVIQLFWRKYTVLKTLQTELKSRNIIVSWWLAKRNEASTKLNLKKVKAINVIQVHWKQAISRKNAQKKKQQILLESKRINFIEKRSKKRLVIFFRNILSNRFCLKATLSLQKWFRAYLPLIRARVLIRGFKRLQVLNAVYCICCYLLLTVRFSVPYTANLYNMHPRNLDPDPDPYFFVLHFFSGILSCVQNTFEEFHQSECCPQAHSTSSCESTGRTCTSSWKTDRR